MDQLGHPWRGCETRAIPIGLAEDAWPGVSTVAAIARVVLRRCALGRRDRFGQSGGQPGMRRVRLTGPIGARPQGVNRCSALRS